MYDLKVTGRFKGMRKDQSFIVYPFEKGEKTRLIQSNTRIARIDLETGKTVLSKSRSNGSYGIDLMPIRGSKIVDCPTEILDQLNAMDAPGLIVRIL